MGKSKVKARILRDARVPTVHQEDWGFDDAQQNEPWRSQLIAFTTTHYNRDDGLVYCGLTSFDNDILWTFNPETKEFASCGYDKVGERFDVKIHRSLVQLEGVIYGATACLHGLDHRLEAPGGKLFKYDPKTKGFEILAIPVKYDYIQTICLDAQRRVIYGNDYPVASFWSHDLKTGESAYLGIANLPHRAYTDHKGNVWGTRDGRLFKYNPDEGFTDFKISMPTFNGQPISVATGLAADDGYVYLGTGQGSVWRFDAENVEFEYLGTPLRDGRCEGLVLGKDGLIYGAGGSTETELFAFDRESGKFHNLGPIYDPEVKERCVIPHDMCMSEDGTIFTGETDNTKRSCYLWECEVEV